MQECFWIRIINMRFFCKLINLGSANQEKENHRNLGVLLIPLLFLGLEKNILQLINLQYEILANLF